MIWKTKPTKELANIFPNAHMGTHLGIEVVEVGDDYIKARMPVDERTKQPFGLLHGGASCVLAETLGSIASTFCIDPTREMAVGVEINANHLRSASKGYVTGVVKPLYVGKTIHVWNIEIFNEDNKQVCASRLTCAIKKHA
ncbi:MAG: hotdog fold thioesterase [Bacteroidetes bacterium]|nr:hotdog fold thioesterase [Bacteroidota bacterium]